MPYAPPTHKGKQHREDARERAKRYGRRWQRLRRAVLAAEPLCRACKERGRLTVANEVDHIVPIVEGGTDERSNLQALCKSCHSAKTRREVNECW